MCVTHTQTVQFHGMISVLTREEVALGSPPAASAVHRHTVHLQQEGVRQVGVKAGRKAAPGGHGLGHGPAAGLQLELGGDTEHSFSQVEPLRSLGAGLSEAAP